MFKNFGHGERFELCFFFFLIGNGYFNRKDIEEDFNHMVLVQPPRINVVLVYDYTLTATI